MFDKKTIIRYNLIGDNMLSINKVISDEYYINKSRFITKLFRIDNPDEINNIINSVKKEYRDATHYCYAYIIDQVKHFDDDGEPSGTAGMPILNVLENNNLNHVLCIVIRYFGGIKLGAGGLVRAYTKSATNVMDNNSFIELDKGQLLAIYFNYNDTKQIDHFLNGTKVVSKEFTDVVIYHIQIPDNQIDKYISFFKDHKIKYKQLNEVYIEKELTQ